MARVFTSLDCLLHDPGFPETPLRLTTVLEALRRDWTGDVIESSSAPNELLAISYQSGRLIEFERRAAAGLPAGQEISLGTNSWRAVLGAIGAVADAVDHAFTTGRPAFAAIRPPGHHASATTAMGFCVVNNVVIASELARLRGATRVLIIDWDVHHGNGTQDMVEADPATHFVSMHQWPWYPGTGSRDERGVGNCFNVPMAPGLERSVYVEALWKVVVEATENWTPRAIIISAGYDGMAGDPLGGFTLEPEDYAEWVSRLRQRFPDVPLIACLEGGYDPDRLAAGVLATVRAME